MVDFRYLKRKEWATLREVRLRALGESPEMFLATLSQESTYGRRKWRAEFKRGWWIVGLTSDGPVSLVGVTYASDEYRYYIEYMWVAPANRGSGIATNMLDFAFARLRRSGIHEIYLWILDGNEPASLLYKKKGFASNDVVHKLNEKKPGRTEEQLKLDLWHSSATNGPAGE